MRFMIIRKADAETEGADLPTEDLIKQMGDYNESMVKAGVMLSGDGLKPSREGARVKFHAGRPTVTDGPFAETREQLAGYYLVDAKDLDEAIGLAARIPNAKDGSIEVRPVMIYN